MTAHETVRFDRPFLLGLGLFIDQLHLSLDRALWAEWSSVVEYFSREPRCGAVADLLCRRAGIGLGPVAALDSRPHPGALLWRWTLGRHVLTGKEAAYIAWWLSRAGRLLETHEPAPTPESIVEVRMQLVYAGAIVWSCFSKRGFRDPVTHFHQAHSLRCRTIEELVGSPWPAPWAAPGSAT